jgi:hypothetical protein
MNQAKVILIALLGVFPHIAQAASTSTAPGKIIYTEGHAVPSCRVVQHRENDTGIVRFFRIASVTGHDDVNAVALTALVANRDVTINYDPAVGSGCGTEPAISYITIQ